VGFRPTVFRVATSLSLGGFVQNRRSEVVVEVEGDEEAVSRFPDLLAQSLPSAARIESVKSEELQVDSDGTDRSQGFRIEESATSDYRFPPIPPDLAICADCARELFHPKDRRYLYPFITCTQCGPRYSIVERTPFDRETTSMRDFVQCPDCLREYTDPEDRRFHSQTNSCPLCGPRLCALDAKGNLMDGDPLILAIHALNEGGIVALQGIGGFHLAVNPLHGHSMERLRAAKERERKPFALMVRDLEEARRLCVITEEEERALASPESPILIAPRTSDSPEHLRAVSDTETLGIMLPYSPLHLLLFRHPSAPLTVKHLVMTSGNRAGEPIATIPAQALAGLSDTADLFLIHDRRILFRADDSIVRMGGSTPRFLMRRSRGYVPRLVTLKVPVKGTILGLGGDLKSAPALAKGSDIHLCPYLGDLDDPETLIQFDTQIHGLLGLYGASVDLVVHDLHPLYRSTQWAERADFPRRTAIQHHFAHVLSVMAEHGLDEALGLSFDGTGYGTDGTIWGGEFLHATRRGFRRLGSFRPFPLPGGEAAVLHPPRITFAIVSDPSLGQIKTSPQLEVPGLERKGEALLMGMLEKRINSPLTSSLGRIFDAAAAALGLVKTQSYEGEGPIRLEGLALRGRESRAGSLAAGGWIGELLPISPWEDGELMFTINAAPLISFLLSERGRRPPEELALRFHEEIAQAALEGARRMRQGTNIETIALSGGVFQNLLLREILLPLLMRDDFQVFLNEKVPPGDGGLSLGQVYYIPE
jgi:hydrogenase maturation protein HypF